MSIKNLKRATLFGSLIGLSISYIFSHPVFFGICTNTYTFGSDVGCLDKFPELISLLTFWLSLSFLSLSLITYFMRDEIFSAWWNFARWFILVIVGATLLLQNAGGGGGWGISSGIAEFVILFLLYFILISVSISRIILTYWELKVPVLAGGEQAPMEKHFFLRHKGVFTVLFSAVAFTIVYVIAGSL